MKKFEYKKELISMTYSGEDMNTAKNIVDELNKHGENGWEAVSIDTTYGDEIVLIIIYFKKEIVEKEEVKTKLVAPLSDNEVNIINQLAIRTEFTVNDWIPIIIETRGLIFTINMGIEIAKDAITEQKSLYDALLDSSIFIQPET